MSDRLYRSNDQRMILGVCGGIAERLELDPTLVRLAFVLLAFVGPGVLVYLIMALVVPRAPALPAGQSMQVLQESAPSSLSTRE